MNINSSDCKNSAEGLIVFFLTLAWEYFTSIISHLQVIRKSSTDYLGVSYRNLMHEKQV